MSWLTTVVDHGRGQEGPGHQSFPPHREPIAKRHPLSGRGYVTSRANHEGTGKVGPLDQVACWGFGSARCVPADPGPVGRASRLVGRGQARFGRFCSGPEDRSPTGTRVVSPVRRHASCAVTDCPASEVASPRRPLSRVEKGLPDGAALESKPKAKGLYHASERETCLVRGL